MANRFQNDAADFMAEREGYSVEESGRVYTKQLFDNSHLVIYKNEDGLWNVQKTKSVMLNTDIEFVQALDHAKNEFKIFGHIEDIIDEIRELDSGDGGNIIDFNKRRR